MAVPAPPLLSMTLAGDRAALYGPAPPNSWTPYPSWTSGTRSSPGCRGSWAKGAAADWAVLANEWLK
ncbi:hypothetical protein ABTZ93_23605 [Streptomyces sp. NPDC097941]|uniref:hypothetical protein n=1 Tax=Streptomyces sp. NPDC097941 TaxID=3155685 RepID=UPI00331803CD